MDLRPHAGRWPFTLEKWYVDALAADGTVLLVYVGRLTAFGLRRGRVTAELFRPGLPPIRGAAPATRWTGGEGWLDAGPARIEGGSLRFELPGLSGALEYAPRHAAAPLGAPFVARGGRRLDWTVEVPDADVTGAVHWPGGTLTMAGRGYRDRVWFDLVPWRFPIRELRWGRVVTGAHASTWAAATTDDGAVSAAWADGRLVPLDDAVPAAFESERVLVDAAVADLPGLGLGAVRGLLRRITRDPREVKRAARATFRGEAGVAVHEIVRWS